MQNLEWKELSREVLYKSEYGRTIEDVVYEMPDGRQEHFHLKGESNSAVVLALTPDNQVILVKQFRPGPGAVLAELPGGGIKKGQSPMDAAAAELLEETGYIGDLQFVTESLADAYCSRTSFAFVATNCVKVAEPTLDTNEFVETVVMSLAEFRAHLRTGKLTDATEGYLGLDYLGLL